MGLRVTFSSVRADKYTMSGVVGSTATFRLYDDCCPNPANDTATCVQAPAAPHSYSPSTFSRFPPAPPASKAYTFEGDEGASPRAMRPTFWLAGSGSGCAAHPGAAAFPVVVRNTPPPKKAVYTMSGLAGSNTTSLAAMTDPPIAGSPPAMRAQLAPPSVVRNKPALVAVQAVFRLVGWTAMRKKAAPVNSAAPWQVQVVPPLTELSTPAPWYEAGAALSGKTCW